MPAHNDQVVEDEDGQQQRTGHDRAMETSTGNGGLEISELEAEAESTPVETSAVLRRSGRHRTAPTCLLPGPGGQLQDYNMPLQDY